MKDSCGCNHCHRDDDSKTKKPEDKIEELKKDIADLGYEVKENKDGEIIVSE